MDAIAVIADVHGNRWALEAVLGDIDRLGVSAIVNLGDVFYGPLDPLGTAELLASRPMPTVRGNEDRLIVEPHAPASATVDFVKSRLRSEHMDWLRSLSVHETAGEALCFHGTPGSDTTYLLWDVGPAGMRLRRSEDVARLAGETDAPLILCGHDHVPRTLRLPDGRLVVNPGSVGLPAYWDDMPHSHVMETGTPHARYAVIFRTKQGWMVTDRAVPYDWAAAAATARQNGRPDWAIWLETGRASEADG